ncbi:MAG: histidine kinase, partial [Chitinophagaceae bacterium]
MANNFRRNLQRGFGISMFLLIATAAASFYSIYKLVDSSEWVDHTNEVIRESENLISSVKDAETAQRGFLLTRQADFLEPYHGSYDRTMAAFRNVKRLTVDNPEQQDNLDTLEVIINKRYNILEQSISETKQGLETNVFVLRDGKNYMEQSRLLVKKIQNAEQKLMVKRTNTQTLFAKYTPILIVITSLLSLVLTLFFFRKIMNDFSEKNDLSQSLARKDREIHDRLTLIDRIAGEIAKGDYSVRVDSK